MRNITLNNQALEDLKYWAQKDNRLLKKVFDLFEAIGRSPMEGIGKPEALKGDLKGFGAEGLMMSTESFTHLPMRTSFIISCRSHYKF